MYSHRCEECGGYHYEDLADDDSWSDIYEQIAADILSNKDYKINAALQQKTAEKLISAVNKGLSAGDIESDRSILGKKLLENIYVFSAAKSATQMKYYRDMMLGEDGAILGKDSFVKKIADTGEIFNKNYLSAEYENAYYSTIMADQWSRYADDEILEYSTAGDSHVRASHKLLDKYTAPKADPFWKTNYPPNGWGCRCTAIPGKTKNVSERQQERFDAGKNSLKIENEKTPFYNNVGISAQIFDEKNHPYFKIFSKPELEEIREESKNVQNLDYSLLNGNPRFSIEKERVLDLGIDKIYKNLNLEETTSIYMYSMPDAYYGHLNNFNRSGKIRLGARADKFNRETLELMTSTINSALDKIPDRFNGIVYRGTDLTFEQFQIYEKAWKNKTVHIEKGFMSTTTEKSKAFDGDTLFIVNAKNGAKIEKISAISGENEVLFKDGQKFKITNIVDGKEGRVIYMDETL